MIKLRHILTEILLLEGPVEDLHNIIDLPIEKFVDKFKDIASDPKVQSVLRAGKRDGDPTDEVVHYSIVNIPVKQLIPTQSEIGLNESLVNVLIDKYKQLVGILANSYEMPPIITLNDKYIIDGHHRWSQVYVANPNADIKCMNFKNPKLTPDDILKAMHLGIAADTGDLPLSTASGINMLNSGENEIKNVVYKTITDPVIHIYKRFKLGSDRKTIAEYIWNNVRLMQRKNKPIIGAPDRNYMPQTGDAKDLPKMIQHGVVNFINPEPQDAE